MLWKERGRSGERGGVKVGFVWFEGERGSTLHHEDGKWAIAPKLYPNPCSIYLRLREGVGEYLKVSDLVTQSGFAGTDLCWSF